MEKIVYNDGIRIGVVQDGKSVFFESEFLNKYTKNSMKIADKNLWKYEGSGARFQGTREEQEQEDIEANIQGITFGANDNEVFYSITVNHMSGIFKKNLTEATSDNESHVTHSADEQYGDLTYHMSDSTLLFTAKDSPFSQHVALFDLASNDYRILTDGDSRDESPIFQRADPNIVYFNSLGIGRDSAGNFVDYGRSSLYCLDRLSGDIRELLSDENLSLVKPREDNAGNLYYISRPVKRKYKKSNIFLDILLIPVKLIIALFNFIEAFTMLFSGKTFSSDHKPSGDNNPAKTETRNDAEIFMDGNVIYAEKNYRENKKRKEKFPGIAPSDWQLCKRDTSGNTVVLKKGVLDYALTSRDTIVYTNGKHIIELTADNTETPITSSALCLHVDVYQK